MSEQDLGEEPFAAEHNWCDRECQRCVLADECPMVVRSRGQRWALRQRGIDPDTPEGHVVLVMNQFESVNKMLEKIAEEDGIDIRNLPPLPPPSFTQKRLTRAALDLITEIGPGTDATSEAILLNMKIARIGGLVDRNDVPAMMDTSDPGSPWRRDGGPNLMLIEHLIRSIAAKLVKDRRVDALLLLAQLELLIEPLMVCVEPLRPYLAARLREGRAPSPFAIVPSRNVED